MLDFSFKVCTDRLLKKKNDMGKAWFFVLLTRFHALHYAGARKIPFRR